MTTTEDDFIEDWKKGFEMAKQAAKSDDSNDFATTRGLYVEATEVLLTTQRSMTFRLIPRMCCISDNCAI